MVQRDRIFFLSLLDLLRTEADESIRRRVRQGGHDRPVRRQRVRRAVHLVGILARDLGAVEVLTVLVLEVVLKHLALDLHDAIVLLASDGHERRKLAREEARPVAQVRLLSLLFCVAAQERAPRGLSGSVARVGRRHHQQAGERVQGAANKSKLLQVLKLDAVLIVL